MLSLNSSDHYKFPNDHDLARDVPRSQDQVGDQWLPNIIVPAHLPHYLLLSYLHLFPSLPQFHHPLIVFKCKFSSSSPYIDNKVFGRNEGTNVCLWNPFNSTHVFIDNLFSYLIFDENACKLVPTVLIPHESWVGLLRHLLEYLASPPPQG